MYAVFLAAVALFAAARRRIGASCSRPTSLAQLLFTPLLAAWSIWVGIAISTRSSDVRVAQQLSLLASLPSSLVTSLIAFDVIHADARPCGRPRVALAAWPTSSAGGSSSPMFDRERLITGSR